MNSADNNRWLISYADFITLLFAFFVMMYAINAQKKEESSMMFQVVSDYFSGEAYQSSRHYVPSFFDQPFQTAPSPLSFIDPIHTDLRNNVEEGIHTGHSENTPTVPIDDVSDWYELTLKRLNERVSHEIGFRHDDKWVEVTLPGNMLFEEGYAELSKPGKALLLSFIATVKDGPYPISIEGFTDDVPISNDIYPSNWHLSVARAATVAQLFETNGIEPLRLQAAGYGPYFPQEPNRSEYQRSTNRRIKIVVQSLDARLRLLSQMHKPYASQDGQPKANRKGLSTEIRVDETTATQGRILPDGRKIFSIFQRNDE